MEIWIGVVPLVHTDWWRWQLIGTFCDYANTPKTVGEWWHGQVCILNFSLVYPVNPVKSNIFFTAQTEGSFMRPYSRMPCFLSFFQHLTWFAVLEPKWELLISILVSSFTNCHSRAAKTTSYLEGLMFKSWSRGDCGDRFFVLLLGPYRHMPR